MEVMISHKMAIAPTRRLAKNANTPQLARKLD
jgi:hypothetical protein